VARPWLDELTIIVCRQNLLVARRGAGLFVSAKAVSDYNAKVNDSRYLEFEEFEGLEKAIEVLERNIVMRPKQIGRPWQVILAELKRTRTGEQIAYQCTLIDLRRQLWRARAPGLEL
jgi:hypothetical protein